MALTLVHRIQMAGQVFTPGSPMNERDLFAGRIPQLQSISDALTQRGYHAVLFGERGVGKTSLANILVATLAGHYIVAKVNCDAGDSFTTIWRKAFREVTYTQVSPGVGFQPQPSTITVELASTLPEVVTPDDVRRLLGAISQSSPVLIILDEFDRLVDRNVAVTVSDTIKALSDFGTNASILLIGVASSVGELVEGHASIERALVQIDMPRMSTGEIGQIIDNGMARLSMKISGPARTRLIQLSQGLPYIAHLLALSSTRSALRHNQTAIEIAHVEEGISDSLEKWQQSIRNDYHKAVNSHQPGNIYKEVLLACALADVDELGYFSAASVRGPLSQILDRTVDIPNYARHLKEFSQSGRGDIIIRTGQARGYRYRFSSPLMRSYVIVKGNCEGLLD